MDSLGGKARKDGRGQKGSGKTWEAEMLNSADSQSRCRKHTPGASFKLTIPVLDVDAAE